MYMYQIHQLFPWGVYFAGDFFAGATAGDKASGKNAVSNQAVDYSKYNNSKSISSAAFFGDDSKQSDKV